MSRPHQLKDFIAEIVRDDNGEIGIGLSGIDFMDQKYEIVGFSLDVAKSISSKISELVRQIEQDTNGC